MEKTLSEKIEDYFLRDDMPNRNKDVQEIIKEAVEKLKDQIRVIEGNNQVNKDYDINCGYALEKIDKIFGEFK